MNQGMSVGCTGDKIVRPLLMQSNLQSVGNGAVGTFARAFAPKMCETAVSRLRMTWTFSKTYLELFTASPGAQLQEITAGTFPIQLGQI